MGSEQSTHAAAQEMGLKTSTSVSSMLQAYENERGVVTPLTPQHEHPTQRQLPSITPTTSVSTVQGGGGAASVTTTMPTIPATNSNVSNIPIAPKISQGTENIISKSDIEAYFKTDFQVKIDPLIFEINKEIIQLRRYFHERPELSFKEVNTAKAIAKFLRSREIEVYENIAKTGVIGVLRGTGSGGGSSNSVPGDGPCILLRADMDALPVLESNDVSYKSKNEGVMHACGHDCHMAILLSVARILTKPEYCNKIHGTIKFCFQPAEEGLAGAKYMIEEGILEYDEKNDIPKVDQVYGLHVWSYEKFGKAVVRDGFLMAGSDSFYVTVKGQGGHGAEPKGTHDAIVAATQLVLQLHTVVSRDLSPLEEGVVTVGKLESGDRGNAIAETAKLEGTYRWFDETVRDRLRERMLSICKGIELSYNVTIDLKFGSNPYPATINNYRECTLNVARAVNSVLPDSGVIRSQPTMCAEDFSFFLNNRPGCFFFLGCGVTPEVNDGNIGNNGNNEEIIYAHHKPNFKVDERCLVTGVQIFVNLILDLMKPKLENIQEGTVGVVPSKPTQMVPRPPNENQTQTVTKTNENINENTNEKIVETENNNDTNTNQNDNDNGTENQNQDESVTAGNGHVDE